jgi:hypothetical protein
MIGKNFIFKRYSVGAIFLATALLLIFVLIGLAGADTQMATSVIASAGGEAA